MRDMIGGLKAVLIFSVVVSLFTSGSAVGQESEAAPQGGDSVPVSSVILDKLDWVISDMVRCVEELRRTKSQWERRYLVEQIEDLFIREVEYPMIYQQTTDEKSLNVIFTGGTADVTTGSEANPLAPKYAEAIALVGIAKGYEGFSAAATDYIIRAQNVYNDVMSIKIKIDSFEDYKTLSQWMADARGRWGGTRPVRVTFHGKSVTQDVVDKLNLENVDFQSAGEEPVGDYYLYAAKRDFLRGMRMKIATDDPLKKNRINEFYIYLPPGHYKLFTNVEAGFGAGTDIEVNRNPKRNQFIIETIQDGVAVYPMVGMRGTNVLEPIEEKAPPEGEAESQSDEQGESTGGGNETE